jgi:hypothetical protein
VEAYTAPVGIKGEFPSAITLFANCTSSEMKVVIDYEYLSGAHGEEVIKEVSVPSENVIETFLFLPLLQGPHGSDSFGI